MKTEEKDAIETLYKKYSAVVDKKNPQGKLIEEFSSHIVGIIKNINELKSWCSKYFYEISKAIRSCLKAYPTYESEEHKDSPCLSFSDYLNVSIRRKINFSKAKKVLEANNGGITISDHTQKMVSKLNKILNNLEITYPDLDEESRIEKAAKMLGVKTETAKYYRQIMNGRNIDIEKIPLADKTASPEKELISGEEAIKKLCKIETAWNKKPDDEMLSKLLTVCVLDMFDMEKNDLDYDFIYPKILNDYFAQMNYRFPEAQEIAKEHGKDKSAATQKLKRFGKKIGIEFKYPRQSKKS